jgi:hypothetical protein
VRNRDRAQTKRVRKERADREKVTGADQDKGLALRAMEDWPLERISRDYPITIALRGLFEVGVYSVFTPEVTGELPFVFRSL